MLLMTMMGYLGFTVSRALHRRGGFIATRHRALGQGARVQSRLRTLQPRLLATARPFPGTARRRGAPQRRCSGRCRLFAVVTVLLFVWGARSVSANPIELILGHQHSRCRRYSQINGIRSPTQSISNSRCRMSASWMNCWQMISVISAGSSARSKQGEHPVLHLLGQMTHRILDCTAQGFHGSLSLLFRREDRHDRLDAGKWIVVIVMPLGETHSHHPVNQQAATSHLPAPGMPSRDRWSQPWQHTSQDLRLLSEQTGDRKKTVPLQGFLQHLPVTRLEDEKRQAHHEETGCSPAKASRRSAREDECWPCHPGAIHLPCRRCKTDSSVRRAVIGLKKSPKTIFRTRIPRELRFTRETQRPTFIYPMIEVEYLTKQFGTKLAVDNLSFTVAKRRSPRLPRT